jgi:hypothetical protein
MKFKKKDAQQWNRSFFQKKWMEYQIILLPPCLLVDLLA